MVPAELAAPLLVVVLALRGAAAVFLLATLVGGVPPLVRLGVAVATGAWTAAATLAAAPVGLAAGALAAIAVRELVIGATIGVVAAVPLLAIATAGRWVDRAAGEARHGPYRVLFGLLGAAVFVGVDGHVAVVAAILDSAAIVPAFARGAQPRVIDALGGLLGAALRLAIPWLVTAAVVELAAGVGARVAGRIGPHASAATGAAVPAALAMITAALLATLAVAMAAVVRGAL